MNRIIERCVVTCTSLSIEKTFKLLLISTFFVVTTKRNKIYCINIYIYIVIIYEA